MAVNVTQSIYQTGADTPAVNLPAGETLNLASHAAILAAGTGATAHGVLATGGNIMNIHGDVFSREANGIFSPGGNNTVSLTATGSVYGLANGIVFATGGNTIANFGDITGGHNAIAISGTGLNTINNSGFIRSGSDHAIDVRGDGNKFVNAGFIEAEEIGIFALGNNTTINNTGVIQGNVGLSFGGGINSVVNSGSIVALGGQYAVSGDHGQDTIINNGLLQASAGGIGVALSGGADIYDGRGGRVIGAVEGEGGTDTLWGGAFFDRLEGGTENDQINGGGSGDYIDGGAGYDLARYDFATTGVQARLDNAALNTGQAAGDTMYNFEGLVGSQHGDILVGNDLAIGNQIHGLGGNDTIRGLAGADILYGNAGSDSIFTGAGTDTVWVQAADRIATQLDRVFDFTDGQDHLRFQGISAASATITDSQGGTLIQFNVAGGQFSVFLDGITKAASADQIFFV